MAATKQCKTCGVEKALEEYCKRQAGHDGHSIYCKQCVNTGRTKGFYAKRREAAKSVTHKVCKECGVNKVLTEYHKSPSGLCGRRERCAACTKKLYSAVCRRTRLKCYNLTLADYDRMLAQQGGRCAICGSTDPGGKLVHFAVDHDHVTGIARALLCNKCNMALGLMGDNPEQLESAARYLRVFQGEAT